MSEQRQSIVGVEPHSRVGRLSANAVLVLLIVLLAGLAFSIWTYHEYVRGDLLHYRYFWRLAGRASLDDLLYLQNRTTGSGEPLYGLLVWLLNPFGRDPVNIVANLMLLGSLVLLLDRHRVPWWFAPFVFTNYYLVMVLGPAERLKFGLLIVAMSFLVTGRKRFFLQLLAPLVHLQTLLYLLPVAVTFLVSHGDRVGVFASRHRAKILALLAIGGGVVIVAAGDAIVREVTTKMNERTFPFQALALFFGAAPFVFSRKPVLGSMLLLLVIAFIIGEGRVVMVMVAFLISTFLVERRFGNPLLWVMLLYFSFKSIGYVETYATYGTGWPQANEYLKDRAFR